MKEKETINQNIMPDYHDLFPQPIKRLTKIAHFFLDQCRHEGLSDHARHPFDEELYGTPEA